MATSGPDSNILDAEAINWRMIVYPLLAVAVLIVGGVGYYFYQLNEREVRETQAHDAVLQAKTPEALVKVADQFSGTTQATLARLNAASVFFDQKNYDAAGKEYQQIVSSAGTDAELRDSAQLGLASTLEANNKVDDAINAYLAVARRGKESPYAPFAYHSLAEIYAQRGDKENEQTMLMQAAGLDPDSPFVKQAQAQLKSMTAVPAPAAALEPPTPEVPVPSPVKP